MEILQWIDWWMRYNKQQPSPFPLADDGDQQFINDCVQCKPLPNLNFQIIRAVDSVV